MRKQKAASRIDADGLASAGLWVRRQRAAPSLTDEALSLAQVRQTWNLHQTMNMERHHVVYAEISSPELQPTWVYLVEVVGHRNDGEPLVKSHPLSGLSPDEPVRILALVQPPDFLVPGALVESTGRRRMLWLDPSLLQ